MGNPLFGYRHCLILSQFNGISRNKQMNQRRGEKSFGDNKWWKFLSEDNKEAEFTMESHIKNILDKYKEIYHFKCICK